MNRKIRHGIEDVTLDIFAGELLANDSAWRRAA